MKGSVIPHSVVTIRRDAGIHYNRDITPASGKTKTGKNTGSRYNPPHFSRSPANTPVIIMTGEIRDFNAAAKTWDENPFRVKLAADVARAMIDTIPLAPDMDVLDFGCGTGLLTLQLQPHVQSITGIDSSEGMLAILNEKIHYGNILNVKTRQIDLDRGDVLTGQYNLIISSMTLHHIRNVPALLAQFYQVLPPSGWIAIADLDPDGGKFHEDNNGVFHFGFEREAQKQAFRDAGFDQVQDRTAATVSKPMPDGQSRSFTVGLITGKKSR